MSQAELRQVERSWQQWVQVSLQGEGGGSGALVGHLVAAFPGAVCVYSRYPKLGLARAAFGSSTSEHKGECAGSELPGWATQQPSWFLQAGTKAQS